MRNEMHLLLAIVLLSWSIFQDIDLFVGALQSPDVFPISRRQALLKKSTDLNPSTYTLRGWSNRPATVLTPVSEFGVYTADRPFYWNKIDVGCRMTVIELPVSQNKENSKGKPDLWVHSPVSLDGPLREALAKLGTVKYIVSPNYEHLKFAPEWHLAYPEAQMWACPGLMERMKNIAWKGEIPFHCRPESWEGSERESKASSVSAFPWDTRTFEAIHIDMEKNPFTGKAFFNEVIFYHVPSKTLITTDFFWNYPANDIPNSQFEQDDTWELAPRVDVPFSTRLWKFGMDNVYAPFFNNFMVTDESAYRDVCEHILNKWDIENVVPAHGDILRGKRLVQDVLRNFFKLDS